MSATLPTAAILDLLMHSSKGNPPEAWLMDRADRLMDFSLAEHERVSELDIGMNRLALNCADPKGAMAMRQMYRQWADQAEALLQGVKECGLQHRLRSKVDALERRVGVTLAMLSITLESIQRGEEDIRNGRTRSLEEVRRELRAAADR